MINLILTFDLYLGMLPVVNIVSILMPFHLCKHLCSCTCVQGGGGLFVHEIVLLVCKDNGGIKAPNDMTNTY